MRALNFVVRIEGRDETQRPIHGTGFLVNDQGYVVTCHHVVENVRDLKVVLPYAEPWPYVIAEKAANHDLVILKGIVPPSAPTPYLALSTTPLATLKGKTFDFFGESAKEHFGSAQQRRCTITGFAEKYGLIGLDGNINPGDSGGPIVDEAGEVLGVIRLRDRDRAGQAMAIPVELVSQLLGKLQGKARRPQSAPAGDVLNALRQITSAQFERVVLMLNVDHEDMPPFAAGQDRRAEQLAILVASGEIAGDRVLNAVADVRAASGFRRIVQEWALTLLARLSGRLYEALATRGLVREPLERRRIEDYHRDLDTRMARDNAVQLVEQEVVDASRESSAFDVHVPRGAAVERIRHLLKLLSGVSHGGDQATAQLASLSRRSKVVRDAVATLVRARRPVILLGEPGSGKSMTLREVARETVHRRSRGPKPPVVVYARLAAYTSTDGDGVGNVIEFIRTQIPPAFQAIRKALPVLIAERRLIVLFDGMDEMERNRYNLRIQELSRFAGENESSVRTLFSCRINDFSPDFTHRQLVLLPFGDPQIREFVRRNVTLPIRVDATTYTKHIDLVRDLRDRSGLADLINNPLMLFLTTRYIHSEQRWPATRAALFSSYVEQHLRKMAAEGRIVFGEGDPPALFDAWSRIAIALLKQKRGDVPLATLAAEDPALERAVDIGKRAGVLQADADDETRIRFAHHRFQEYFAARSMARPDGEAGIDWSRGLDLPAWQETLLNLASMQPECRALTVLEESLREPVTKLEAEGKLPRSLRPPRMAVDEIDDSVLEQFFKEAARERQLELQQQRFGKWPLDPSEERLWADRIVLASQIVREAAAQKTQLPAEFESTFRESLKILAAIGRPTSQVKMLWAWKNAPGSDVTAALAKPLESPIGWVRDQAILLVASVSRTDVSRNLGIDLSIDLAAENVVRRMGTFLRAARDNGRQWVALAVWAACCQILFWLLAFGGAAIAVALAVDRVAPYRGPFASEPLLQGLLGIAVLGLSPLVRRWKPVGPGRAVAASAYVLACLWVGAWLMVRTEFGNGFAMTFVALFLIAPAIYVEIAFWAAAFAFLVPLQIVATKQTRVTAARVMWRSPASMATREGWTDKNMLKEMRSGVFAVTLFVVLSLLWRAFKPVLERYGIVRVLLWIFQSVGDALPYIFTGIFSLIVLGWAIFSTVDEDYSRWIRVPLALLVLTVIGMAGAWVFIPSAKLFLRASLGWWIHWLTVLAPWLALIAVGILVFVLFGLLVHVYLPLLKTPLYLARIRVTSEWWVMEMRRTHPLIQARLLQIERSRFVPKALTAQDYLALLIAVEQFVDLEPAAGVYWQKRQEIEQAVRHESHSLEA